MSGGLFGRGATSNANRNLVEFRAGKMSIQGNMVKPDKRKGLVYVYQSEDTLNHFCWKDRTTNTVEDDLILFPDDLEYKRITKCTTGRVFLVNLKSANKKIFFWMQEPDSEKDEKLWKKLLDTLNGVDTSSSSDRPSSTSLSSLANVLGGDLGGSDIQSLLGSMSEQQIQQLLGLSGFGGSQSSSRASSSRPSRVQSSRQAPTTAAATPTTTNQAQPMDTASATTTTTTSGSSDANKKLQFSEFQNLLQNLSQNPATQQSKIDLADMITLDVMAPILANKEIQERLMPHLPEGDVLPKNESELRNTFSEPQFKRAMHSFSDALQSGQLGPLLAQFNLPKEVIDAANNGNLEEFAKAMQSYSKSTKSTQEEDQKMDH